MPNANDQDCAAQPTILSFTQPVNEVMAHLDEQVSQLTAQYQSVMRCKAGCSGCCLDGFHIRFAEALLLWEGLIQLPPTTFANFMATIQNEDSQQAPKGLASCPLLGVDGRCQVYAHRPALCRGFGVLIAKDDGMATCELNFTQADKGTLPDEPLRALNLVPYYTALEGLSQQYHQQVFPNVALPESQSIKQWLLTFARLFAANANSEAA